MDVTIWSHHDIIANVSTIWYNCICSHTRIISYSNSIAITKIHISFNVYIPTTEFKYMSA